VLAGTPTLRTADGDEPALALAVSTANSPDVVMYPESETVGVATRHPFDRVQPGADEGVVGSFRVTDNLRGGG
jgi:hypothetical protein